MEYKQTLCKYGLAWSEWPCNRRRFSQFDLDFGMGGIVTATSLNEMRMELHGFCAQCTLETAAQPCRPVAIFAGMSRSLKSLFMAFVCEQQLAHHSGSLFCQSWLPPESLPPESLPTSWALLALDLRTKFKSRNYFTLLMTLQEQNGYSSFSPSLAFPV